MTRLWVFLLVSAAFALGACGDDDTEKVDERTSPVVWRVDPRQSPTVEDDTFRVEVRGVECDGGSVTRPLPPDVEESEEEVVIRFAEPAPSPDTFHSCEGNMERVVYDITLSAPIGSRRLIDAECLPGAIARNTLFCDSGEVRYADGKPVLVRW